tara:strand:+ start:318 stop:716 length:399 start_codon:yes stop_codon:yes gene_type:complete
MQENEIYKHIQEILEEALGAETDEIIPSASLVADLGAESIDFLDISFKLEQVFNFKIAQGELFPENLMENPDWVSDGKFTNLGLEQLRKCMPHVNFNDFEKDPQVSKVGDVITVSSICDFVKRKLNSENQSS